MCLDSKAQFLLLAGWRGGGGVCACTRSWHRTTVHIMAHILRGGHMTSSHSERVRNGSKAT